MRKIIAAMMLGISMMTCLSGQPIIAAEADEAISSAFSDGSGSVGALASNLAQRVSDDAVEYKTQWQEAKAARITKAASDAHQKAVEDAKKAAVEANRKFEEKRIARRQEIVDFALQFEGNPYVYGGTSLTNGADCSGFVMSVFKEFGVELPRVAASQCSASRKKDIKDIEPGDLCFYGYGISHVALYIGNGKIIHASTSATGIKISDYDYETPVAIGTYIL